MLSNLFVMAQVCSESDYEMWNPPGNDQCLMGRKVTMQRRKPTANCFNDKRWARAGATYEPCQCEHVSPTLLPQILAVLFSPRYNSKLRLLQ